MPAAEPQAQTVGSQAWAEANPATLVDSVNSQDPAMQLTAVTQLRKLLSIERSPPIEEVIAAGVVPRLVQFLQCGDNPMLQFEAAWALTNIASGTSEHTMVVIANGAVPIFVQLLRSPNDDVREQAVWALGNIAGDSPQYRDLVLTHGVLTPLLEQLNPNSKMSMLRNATWTLSNLCVPLPRTPSLGSTNCLRTAPRTPLSHGAPRPAPFPTADSAVTSARAALFLRCRGKPQPAWHLVSPALPVLAQLVFSNDDEVPQSASRPSPAHKPLRHR